jgi:hypothetical protein
LSSPQRIRSPDESDAFLVASRPPWALGDEKTNNEFFVVPERFCPERHKSPDMADEETEAELREQFTDAFEGADFPVSNPMDLVPALPNGPGTRFEAGDVSFTAMELSTKLSDTQDFPYDDVDSLVDDLIEGLKQKDMI